MTSLTKSVLCALLVCGCSFANRSLAQAATNAVPAILVDQILARADIVSRVKAAEQDLAADEWHTNEIGGHGNVSRLQRELPVSEDVLHEALPQFARLNACELVAQLKTFPPGSEASPEGVTYNVYLTSNKKIIDLLKKRPNDELECLQKFKDDQRMVFAGEDGTSFTIDDLVRRLSLKE